VGHELIAAGMLITAGGSNGAPLDWSVGHGSVTSGVWDRDTGSDDPKPGRFLWRATAEWQIRLAEPP
jgi:hypothetical protein